MEGNCGERKTLTSDIYICIYAYTNHYAIVYVLADIDGAVLQRVPGLVGIKVVDIAAGAEHSAIVTGKVTLIFHWFVPDHNVFIDFSFQLAEEGEIKIWGWGEHGQLGLGSTRDESSPQTVSLGDEVERKDGTVRVYCGSGYTFAIRTFCS